MNNKVIFALAALAIVGFGYQAHAQVVSETPTVAIAPMDPITLMASELDALKAQETDPTTGFFERFFLRLKIRELENKLNIVRVFE